MTDKEKQEHGWVYCEKCNKYHHEAETHVCEVKVIAAEPVFEYVGEDI